MDSRQNGNSGKVALEIWLSNWWKWC